jgi:hypothetical protein
VGIAFAQHPYESGTFRWIIGGILFFVEKCRIVFDASNAFFGNDLNLSVALTKKDIQEQPNVRQQNEQYHPGNGFQGVPVIKNNHHYDSHQRNPVKGFHQKKEYIGPGYGM